MKNACVAIRRALIALVALLWAVLFFFPMPVRISAGEERYPCLWESGTETAENYASAFRDLSDLGIENGAIVLRRGGIAGKIELGEACVAAVRTFENGNLGEIAALSAEGTSRLEHAALFRRYRRTLLYAGGWLRWTGDSVVPTEVRGADEVMLMSGGILSKQLIPTGAKTLYVRAEAELGWETMIGTAVERVVAQAPYQAEGNAVCLQTPGGLRLVAGLPLAESVTIPTDVRFADEGALLACSRIGALTLPFVGSAASAVVTGFRGELAHLFSTGELYEIPQTLRSLRVTGGVLVSHAFYGCDMLREIDACGLAGGDIDPYAFEDCSSLQLLHTPRADVVLQGKFHSIAAPCGCTIYERAD